MPYYAKESIVTGRNSYWERSLRASPYATREAAVACCLRNAKDDNHTFVQDQFGHVIYVGPKGKEFV